MKCISLKVLGTQDGGPDDAAGVVEFHAKLLINGKRTLHQSAAGSCGRRGAGSTWTARPTREDWQREN